MKIITIIFFTNILFFYTFSLLFTQALGEMTTDLKGVRETTSDNRFVKGVAKKIAYPLNDINVFKNIKKNNLVAFLVGNNDYVEGSKYGRLNYCINDIRLISRILETCCHVPLENIFCYNNLTKGEFTSYFNKVKTRLGQEQGFFFFYSGHGNKDGSLVFTDEATITPHELKDTINSFKNDSIIILDACYSGNNEGPLECKSISDYKKNSIRIYSSLAHMTAKEISYENEFFDYIKPFYENVLGLKDKEAIEGNGYFSSYIGYFFAEFNFKESKNISIWDLMNYVFNKNRHYVEYLAIRSKSQQSFAYESELRMDQQPKIAPLTRQVDFRNTNHQYLLIKKYEEPLGLVPELLIGPYFNLGIFVKGVNNVLWQNRASFSTMAQLSYSPSFFKGFSVGIQTGYLFAFEGEDKANNKRQEVLHMVPFIFNVGYQKQFIQLNNRDLLSIRAYTGIGVSFNFLNLKKYSVLPDYNYNLNNFCFQTSIGVGLYPLKNFSIAFDIQLFGTVFDKDSILLGLTFPFSVSYKL